MIINVLKNVADVVGVVANIYPIPEKEFFFMKISRDGFKYHDKLPDGYRLATLDDFHVAGKKKLGMEFLIQSGNDPSKYWIYELKEIHTGRWLSQFISNNSVFVKS